MSKKEMKTIPTEEAADFTAYDHKIHRWGRLSTLFALVAMYLPIIGICLRYHVSPDWAAVGAGCIAILVAFGANQIIEPFTFAPMLGAGGTYMGFTTGNVSQTKIPCVVSCQEIMGVEMGTKEGDVVATLAVGTCSLVTTLEVALGVAFVHVIYPVLTSPTLAPGFNNVLPAVMGAMLFQRIMANWKVGVVPFILGCLAAILFGQAWYSKNGLYIMLVLIAITVGWAYCLYKKGKIQ